MKNTIKAVFVIVLIICLIVMVLPVAASGVDDNHSDDTMSAPIFTGPARIELKAERSHVTSDYFDNINITAYVYDEQGNAVADGYDINFTVGNATDNGFTEHGFTWTAANGSLNAYGRQNATNVPTGDNGSASVRFGWVSEYNGSVNSTIWAYCADDASVFSSIKIYFSAPGPSWTGYVVDSFGSGYGGVNVKLHVIGYDRNGPYEIYNMTRKTGSSPPFAGLFTFDYIVLEGPAYGYVDAETRLTDNLTIYGKSDNFSINGSAMPIGNIVLNIPPPDAIKITAEKGTVIAGGEEDWITARLYLNGSPYRRADVNVTFSSDNDTIATLPTVKTNATDLDGRAMILLVSNYTAGTVNIAGEAAIMNNYYFTDTAIVRVADLAGPSAMATPTPGFEALLALAGLLGAAYLIVMRDNQ